MTIEKCSTCKFYRMDQEVRRGLVSDDRLHPNDFEAECRRYPPTHGEVAYFGSLTDMDIQCDVFSGPIVSNSGWCGEWRPAVGGQP